MTTEVKPQPKLGDPSSHWPPVAHIVPKDKLPAKEGDIALCGEKLMGLNLDDAEHVCEKCLKIMARQIGL